MKLKSPHRNKITRAATGLLLVSSFVAACTPAAAPADPQADVMTVVAATFQALTPNTPPEVLTIVAATFQALTPSPAPTATPVPPTAVMSPTITPTATQDTRLTAKYWPEYPVVPKITGGAQAIYALGQKLGNNPRTYSVVGDCQSDPDVFMGTFDTDRYRLPDANLGLQETINQFKGSFGRQSVSVKDGMSVSSALSPLWADQTQCLPNESPIICEYRLNKPSFVFINLGTNWKSADMDAYENYLRQIVDFWVKNGVVPILSTKVDNLEGNHLINLAAAQVAYDYDIPVWNFWKAADKLPNHGLDPMHDPTQPLTYLTSDAWYMRSITGLQTLDSVWRGVAGLPPAAGTPTVSAVTPTMDPLLTAITPTVITAP
ncbi:MAG: hypothetical protein AB9891_01055 [Anaerolineaceae bacterium]